MTRQTQARETAAQPAASSGSSARSGRVAAASSAAGSSAGSRDLTQAQLLDVVSGEDLPCFVHGTRSVGPHYDAARVITHDERCFAELSPDDQMEEAFRLAHVPGAGNHADMIGEVAEVARVDTPNADHARSQIVLRFILDAAQNGLREKHGVVVLPEFGPRGEATPGQPPPPLEPHPTPEADPTPEAGDPSGEPSDPSDVSDDGPSSDAGSSKKRGRSRTRMRERARRSHRKRGGGGGRGDSSEEEASQHSTSGDSGDEDSSSSESDDGDSRSRKKSRRKRRKGRTTGCFDTDREGQEVRPLI